MHKIVKRRRTAHACESCRHRKSRCDGKRPICGVCRRTGNDCNYLVPAKSTQQSLPEETSHAVETRLQALEHTLHDFIAQQASFSKYDEVSTQVSPSKPSHVPKPNTSQQDINPTAVNWDIVGGMGSIAPKEELGKTYFGPTSTSAFLAQINRFLAQRAPIPLDSISGTLNATATNYSTTYMSRPNTPTPSKSTVAGSLQANSSHVLEDSSFPPRTELLRLVDAFFSNSGTLFPFLRKSRIFQLCLKIDTASHRPNNSSEMCIVYMVLAMASIFNTFDTDAEQKLREGEVFLQKALAYLSELMCQTLTLESVQALVLVTKYFQGTRRAGQMWSMHSTTVQAAIQIGMCSMPAASDVTAAEAESWKRTWWMCFQMDRMCSMTFGRPPLIPNSFMRHSLPSNHSYESLEEEDIRTTTDKSSEYPSESSLIIHTSKLNFILGDIIEHIYQQNIEMTPKLSLAEGIIEITKTDQRLHQWENELPEFLGLINANEASQLSDIDRTQRFRIILTLRYHSVRALAHRAILTQVMENNNTSQFTAIECSSQRNFSIASLESCLESSSASIGIISSTVLQEGSLPVWWFSIYYIFNSALNVFTLLLISIKHDLAFRNHSSEQLFELLKRADTTLNNVKGSLELRERCCKVLRRLIQIASISLQGKVAMATSINTSASYQNDSVNFTSSSHPRYSFPDSSASGWDEGMLVSDLDPFLLDPLDEDELSWFL